MGRPKKNKSADEQPANNNSSDIQPTENDSDWSLGCVDENAPTGEYPAIDNFDENPEFLLSGEIIQSNCEDNNSPTYLGSSSISGVDFSGVDFSFATNEYAAQVHRNYTKLLRDKYGLLNSVEHKFREDGYVDWQAMIPNEFLAVNKKNFEARGIDIPENIEDVAEKDKLILLDGFKHIARLRGVKSILKTLSSPSSNYVVATCTVSFLPNYEYPNGLEVTGEADCNADYERTFTAQVIATIAGNRAFIRAIRHALNIKIYGQDEMSSMDNPENKENHRLNKVRKTLSDLCNDKNISFDGLKKALVKNGITNALEYKDFKDIPIDQCSLAISKIKEKFQ